MIIETSGELFSLLPLRYFRRYFSIEKVISCKYIYVHGVKEDGMSLYEAKADS